VQRFAAARASRAAAIASFKSRDIREQSSFKLRLAALFGVAPDDLDGSHTRSDNQSHPKRKDPASGPGRNVAAR
jgi:hypothetical protein